MKKLSLLEVRVSPQMELAFASPLSVCEEGELKSSCAHTNADFEELCRSNRKLTKKSVSNAITNTGAIWSENALSSSFLNRQPIIITPDGSSRKIKGEGAQEKTEPNTRGGEEKETSFEENPKSEEDFSSKAKEKKKIKKNGNEGLKEKQLEGRKESVFGKEEEKEIEVVPFKRDLGISKQERDEEDLEICLLDSSRGIIQVEEEEEEGYAHDNKRNFFNESSSSSESPSNKESKNEEPLAKIDFKLVPFEAPENNEEKQSPKPQSPELQGFNGANEDHNGLIDDSSSLESFKETKTQRKSLPSQRSQHSTKSKREILSKRTIEITKSHQETDHGCDSEKPQELLGIENQFEKLCRSVEENQKEESKTKEETHQHFEKESILSHFGSGNQMEQSNVDSLEFEEPNSAHHPVLIQRDLNKLKKLALKSKNTGNDASPYWLLACLWSF